MVNSVICLCSKNVFNWQLEEWVYSIFGYIRNEHPIVICMELSCVLAHTQNLIIEINRVKKSLQK